ncbi:MAG: hypothetical protein GXO82_00025 [Chlorobi bacterium]|nr:hypothetical protein [Chlorobiota bacterium]
MRRIIIASALAVMFVALGPGSAQAQDGEEYAPPKVAILDEFHEVIYVLWHQAWPSKDYQEMKELLPQVQEFVEKIEAYELPHQLHEKEGKWREAVAGLRQAAEDYKKAAAEDNDKALLNAVEDLHAQFEALTRVVRPKLRELEEFHTVLYYIYHYYMPEKNVEKLRSASLKLAERAQTLVDASLPRRLKDVEKEFRSAAGSLKQAADDLVKVAAGDDVAKMDEAVETVHSRYEEVVSVLDPEHDSH